MTLLTRRQFLQYAGVTAGSSALAALAVPSAFAAEAFPNRPLALVVPYPAGGASDTSRGSSANRSARA